MLLLLLLLLLVVVVVVVVLPAATTLGPCFFSLSSSFGRTRPGQGACVRRYTLWGVRGMGVGVCA